VFVSSHLMSEMALTADHLVVIGRGRLIADSSTTDLIAASSQGYVHVAHARTSTDWPGRLRIAGGGRRHRGRLDAGLPVSSVRPVGELAGVGSHRPA